MGWVEEPAIGSTPQTFSTPHPWGCPGFESDKESIGSGFVVLAHWRGKDPRSLQDNAGKRPRFGGFQPECMGSSER